MRGEPFRGILAKPQRHSAVKRKAKAVRRLSRAQCVRKVYMRERMHCQRCRFALSLECYPPDPRYPHVNEMVPRSKGGDPCDPDNCELLCGDCHMPRGEHAPTKARMDKLNELAAKAKRLKALARG
jgi:5-methylcytosine-specific restriction endonuclease McrA